MTTSSNLWRRSLLSIIDFHSRSREELRIRIRIGGKTGFGSASKWKTRSGWGDAGSQRILKYLWRARLSCRLMIWLSPTSYTLATQDWERETTCGRERREEGWGRSQTQQRRKSLVLYKYLILSARSHWRLCARSQITLAVIVFKSFA